jgi:hypothetical protein
MARGARSAIPLKSRVSIERLPLAVGLVDCLTRAAASVRPPVAPSENPNGK